MQETRFLLGLQKDPSPGFFRATRSRMGSRIVRRVGTDLPIVLANAPDDNPVVAEVLTSRALSLSRRPADEAVIVVGLASATDSVDDYSRMLSRLAEQLRAKGGFATAHAVILEPQASRQAARERAQERLRKLARELGRSRRVLVVPHALSGAAASRTIRRALQGVFMRYSENGLLPDERIIRWACDSARQASGLPDMRTYKDAGRLLPEPADRRNPKPSRLMLQEENPR
jgi:hypothetical protein